MNFMDSLCLSQSRPNTLEGVGLQSGAIILLMCDCIVDATVDVLCIVDAIVDVLLEYISIVDSLPFCNSLAEGSGCL